MFTAPRRILELALEGDRVKTYTETGLSLDRIIQQAIYLAETDTSLDLADLAQQVLRRRETLARARSAQRLS